MADLKIKRLKKGDLLRAPDAQHPDDRRVVMVMTSGTVDRDGETVDPEGGDFSEFGLNPVLVENHETGKRPLGSLSSHDDLAGPVPDYATPVHEGVSAWVEDIGDGTRWPTNALGVSLGEKRRALLCNVFFSKANKSGDEAFQQYKEGTMSGGSISFVPAGATKSNESGGNHYGRWKLLEFTSCTVGSNPDAVTLRKRLENKNVKHKSVSAFRDCEIETERVASGWHWCVTRDGKRVAESRFPQESELQATEAAEEWIAQMAQKKRLKPVKKRMDHYRGYAWITSMDDSGTLTRKWKWRVVDPGDYSRVYASGVADEATETMNPDQEAVDRARGWVDAHARDKKPAVEETKRKATKDAPFELREVLGSWYAFDGKTEVCGPCDDKAECQRQAKELWKEMTEAADRAEKQAKVKAVKKADGDPGNGAAEVVAMATGATDAQLLPDAGLKEVATALESTGATVERPQNCSIEFLDAETGAGKPVLCMLDTGWVIVTRVDGAVFFVDPSVGEETDVDPEEFTRRCEGCLSVAVAEEVPGTKRKASVDDDAPDEPESVLDAPEPRRFRRRDRDSAQMDDLRARVQANPPETQYPGFVSEEDKPLLDDTVELLEYRDAVKARVNAKLCGASVRETIQTWKPIYEAADRVRAKLRELKGGRKRKASGESPHARKYEITVDGRVEREVTGLNNAKKQVDLLRDEYPDAVIVSREIAGTAKRKGPGRTSWEQEKEAVFQAGRAAHGAGEPRSANPYKVGDTVMNSLWDRGWRDASGHDWQEATPTQPGTDPDYVPREWDLDPSHRFYERELRQWKLALAQCEEEGDRDGAAEARMEIADVQAALDAGPWQRINMNKAKRLRRKAWLNKKTRQVWLLKSEGSVTAEQQEYLEQRGLDDVRVSKDEPDASSEEWWLLGKDEAQRNREQARTDTETVRADIQRRQQPKRPQTRLDKTGDAPVLTVLTEGLEPWVTAGVIAALEAAELNAMQDGEAGLAVEDSPAAREILQRFGLKWEGMEAEQKRKAPTSDQLQDAIDVVESASEAVDVPKHVKAALKNALTGLKNADCGNMDTEAVGEVHMSVEEESDLRKALDENREESKKLNKSLYRATGVRLTTTVADAVERS